MNDDKIKGYIICETTSISQPKIISDKNDITVIETVLQDDLPNRNKRIYPINVLRPAILESPYIQERLRRKAWYGEAGHPLDSNIQRQLYIDQTRISHIISNAWFEGSILKGNVMMGHTQVSKDMQSLVRCGSEVAFSMRGFGPVSEKRGDLVEIKAPLNILTYDWVIHPSHPAAYMTGIIQESTLDLFRNDGKIIDDIFEPITESQYMDFITEQSKNVQSMAEQFEFMLENASYNPNDKMVYLKKDSDVLAIKLEDAIAFEIDDYLSKF